MYYGKSFGTSGPYIHAIPSSSFSLPILHAQKMGLGLGDAVS